MAKAEAGATPMEAIVLRALSDNLVETGFSGRAWTTLELVQQLTTWLAQMSDDRETAMQQVAAARIIEPRASDEALWNYAPVGSSSMTMLLLALALFAVLGQLALPVLAGGMRRLRVAMGATGLRLHAGWAYLARVMRDVPVHLAGKMTALLMPPRRRVRYAVAVPR